VDDPEAAALAAGGAGVERHEGRIGPQAAARGPGGALDRQHPLHPRRLARPGLHLSEPALEQRALQPQTVAALDLRDQPPVAIVGRLGQREADLLAVEQCGQLGARLLGERQGAAGVTARNTDAGKPHRAAVGEAQLVAANHLGDRERADQGRLLGCAGIPVRQ
jgi:hypothetical protein